MKSNDIVAQVLGSLNIGALDLLRKTMKKMVSDAIVAARNTKTGSFGSGATWALTNVVVLRTNVPDLRINDYDLLLDQAA